jgi:hypothetical protein
MTGGAPVDRGAAVAIEVLGDVRRDAKLSTGFDEAALCLLHYRVEEFLRHPTRRGRAPIALRNARIAGRNMQGTEEN